MRSPSGDDVPEGLATLTHREREILKLFAQGLTYQEIGEIRKNSALTVRNVVSGIQKKLGFKTRQQMVVWAVRTDLVDDGSSQSPASRNGMTPVARPYGRWLGGDPLGHGLSWGWPS